MAYSTLRWGMHLSEKKYFLAPWTGNINGCCPALSQGLIIPFPVLRHVPRETLCVRLRPGDPVFQRPKPARSPQELWTRRFQSVPDRTQTPDHPAESRGFRLALTKYWPATTIMPLKEVFARPWKVRCGQKPLYETVQCPHDAARIRIALGATDPETAAPRGAIPLGMHSSWPCVPLSAPARARASVRRDHRANPCDPHVVHHPTMP